MPFTFFSRITMQSPSRINSRDNPLETENDTMEAVLESNNENNNNNKSSSSGGGVVRGVLNGENEEPVNNNNNNKNNTTAYCTRELLLGGLSGNTQGYVDVRPSMTLADVRRLAKEELDDDMLPGPEFYFCVDGVRMSSKQEARKQVWDWAAVAAAAVAQSRPVVTLHAKVVVDPNNNDKRPRDNNDAEETTSPSPTKKVRISEETETESSTPTSSTTTDRDESSSSPTSTSSSEPNLNNGETDLEHDDGMGDDNGGAKEHVCLQETDWEPDDGMGDDNGGAKEHVCSQETDWEPDDGMGDDNGGAKEHVCSQETDWEPDFDLMLVESETEEAAQATEEEEDADDMENDPVETADGANTVNNENENSSTLEEANDDQGHRRHHRKDEDQVTVIEEETQNDPHRLQKQAQRQSCTVLQEIDKMLHENPLFCSEDRRMQLSSEIKENLQKSSPNTIIGVLGNTGVGKSSLLNALLDEASVLPTSGSRGCTAAVVELRYNKDMVNPVEESIPVYKGEVEFITLQEWLTDLKILVEECSTHDSKTVYVVPPESERMPDAAAAWAKINSVYGGGTMESFRGEPMDYVFDRLSKNPRVVNLLTPEAGSGKQYKAILVEEGQVDQHKARILLQGFAKMNTRMRRAKKKWAQQFRSKINDYVYRKGNGSGPQTWPLIRKVVLEGPWPVLSTGACLVDLPGVRDANAARAKVSENYLQNCSQIWVVAPIKRAVDDGTAKELLGEQFKRRLLMDGQYGNVSFVCTQTDDCEATEIMRDHMDVAMQKPGRWEKMTSLRDELLTIEKDLSDLIQEREDLELKCEENEEELAEAEKELEEARKDPELDEEMEVDIEFLQELQASVKEKSRNSGKARLRLETWKKTNSREMEQMQETIRVQQRRLKSICATVRNEYSTAFLQEDFRAGLKELCRKADDDDEGDNGLEGATNIPLPEDFQMDVYCISANDYLKVAGIKSSSDGPPNTFSSTEDTQIPSLRAFVHETTAKYQVSFTEALVNSVSDMVDRVKLLAADVNIVTSARSARRYQSIFDTEMLKLEADVKIAAEGFRHKAKEKVNSSLQPSLKAGASKGRDSAMQTVVSWGSKSRRNKHERGPHQNGLYWSTYNATVRRDGVYVSASAGAIDMNQELCDPMEKEFGSNWQQTMDAAFRNLLLNCERMIFELCSNVDKALVSSFVGAGMDVARLGTIANTATRTYTTALKLSFEAMRTFATDTQRSLNRSLLPLVQSRMKLGYESSQMVPRGSGRFSRMKNAMEDYSREATISMFDESIKELVASIDRMISQLETMITAAGKLVSSHLRGVFSVCWEDQSDKSNLIDPEMQEKIRACRDQLLPRLNQLRKMQDDAMDLVGVEREELDLDVTAVASLETRIEESFKKAEERGEVIDLSISDDEDTKPAAKSAWQTPLAETNIKKESFSAATPWSL